MSATDDLCGCGHLWRDHESTPRGGRVCRDLRSPNGPSCPGCHAVLADIDDPNTTIGAIRAVVLDHADAYWIPGIAGREFWRADGEGFDMGKIHARAGAWADLVAPRIARALVALDATEPTP